MKIIQITDLHVGTENEIPYEIDVRQNFLNTLQAVKDRAPDHIIVTGDLCLDEGVTDIYEWVKDRLDLLGISYDVQSGNHDDTRKMATVFGLENKLIGEELFYKKYFGTHTALFLDTSAYHLSQQQLVWLNDELQMMTGEVLIFIHHPPIYGGVPFMDNGHPLKNYQEVEGVLLNYAYPINIFCGHYHVDKTIRKGNLMVQITPSLYFQINDAYEEFQLDHKRIGFREIILDEEGLRTSVRYL